MGNTNNLCCSHISSGYYNYTTHTAQSCAHSCLLVPLKLTEEKVLVKMSYCVIKLLTCCSKTLIPIIWDSSRKIWIEELSKDILTVNTGRLDWLVKRQDKSCSTALSSLATPPTGYAAVQLYLSKGTNTHTHPRCCTQTSVTWSVFQYAQISFNGGQKSMCRLSGETAHPIGGISFPTS